MRPGRQYRGFGAGASHHRRPIVIAISFGLVFLVGLGVLLTYPRALAEADAYSRAGACFNVEEAATPNARCLYSLPATVDRTYVRHQFRGGPRYMVDVNLPDGSRRTVQAGRKNSVYDGLQPAQEVRLEVWRTRVAALSTADGGVIQTTDNPSFNKSDQMVVGVGVTVFGLFGLWIAYRARRRGGSWTRPEDGLDLGGSPESTLVVAVGFFALCAGIIAYGYFQASALVALMVGAGLAVVLGILIAWRLATRGIPLGWRRG